MQNISFIILRGYVHGGPSKAWYMFLHFPTTVSKVHLKGQERSTIKKRTHRKQEQPGVEDSKGPRKRTETQRGQRVLRSITHCEACGRGRAHELVSAKSRHEDIHPTNSRLFVNVSIINQGIVYHGGPLDRESTHGHANKFCFPCLQATTRKLLVLLCDMP